MSRATFMPSLRMAFLGLALAFALFQPLLSGDLGWHIRVGQEVHLRGEPPRLNFLTFTAPWHPWLTHEWLSGVLFAGLDDLGGLPLLFAARGMLFFLTLLLLGRLGSRLGAESFGLAGGLLLLLVTLALNVALRPWLFSNFLVALSLWLAWRARTSPHPTRALLAFLPLQALWINLHGEFMVGWTFFGLLLLERLLRRPVALEHPRPTVMRRGLEVMGLGLGSLFLLLLNPHGIDAVVLPLLYLLEDGQSGVALKGLIKEWSPIALDSFFGGVYLLWIGLLMVSLWMARHLRARAETLMALGFLTLTFQSQRHLPLFALFAFPVIAEGLLLPLARWLDVASSRTAVFWQGLSRQEAPERSGFLALVSGAMLTLHFYTASDPLFEARSLAPKGYPLAAITRLEQLPPGRLFNHYDWAGLIAWRAPAWPLFITPVNDAYPRALLQDWFDIANLAPAWSELLAGHGVDTVLMPTSSALVEQLKRQPGWRVRYEDREATLLILDPKALAQDLDR